MEVRSPCALIIPAPATLHKIHLVLNGLREATHAARSIIMQGWNGPLGSYLHLSVFPATSNLLMIIKEQRGPAAPWKQAPSSREWPSIHNHPELKPLFDKNQEKLAGRLPRTTCKPPATPGWDGYSKYSEQHAVISKQFYGCTNFFFFFVIIPTTTYNKEQLFNNYSAAARGGCSGWTLVKVAAIIPNALSEVTIFVHVH